jgi:hypothetical protein
MDTTGFLKLDVNLAATPINPGCEVRNRNLTTRGYRHDK